MNKENKTPRRAQGGSQLEPIKGHKCPHCRGQAYRLPINDRYDWETCDDWRCPRYRTKIKLIDRKKK